MAFWSSLPYELKLHVAKYFINIILAQVPRVQDCPFHIPLAVTIRRHLGDWLTRTKRQVWALVQVNPELHADLADYCERKHEQLSSEAQNARPMLKDILTTAEIEMVAHHLTYGLLVLSTDDMGVLVDVRVA